MSLGVLDQKHCHQAHDGHRWLGSDGSDRAPGGVSVCGWLWLLCVQAMLDSTRHAMGAAIEAHSAAGRTTPYAFACAASTSSGGADAVSDADVEEWLRSPRGRLALTERLLCSDQGRELVLGALIAAGADPSLKALAEVCDVEACVRVCVNTSGRG